jgi:hypothetical protein
VDPVEGLVVDEALEGFDAEGELAEGEGAFVAEASAAEAAEVLLGGVFGAVDQAEVFAAAAFDPGLGEAAFAAVDHVEWFDDHAFAGEDLERRQPEIVDGWCGPAVFAIGVNESSRHVLSFFGLLQQFAYGGAALGCAL